MPHLQRIGKDKVINHHHDVPFKVLEKQYSFGDEGAENMIIHGDNLEGLKSLLPQYEGKVKCIYIDPPYNTGNEGRVYNDNMNHPKIKKWLGAIVGKEGEDFNRHDKWLCMMYPRLKLLHKLLRDDGVIFISIDDNEQANLKLMMDEIFGQSGFIANFVRKRRASSQLANNKVSIDHEYVMAYSRSPMTFNGIKKDYGSYKNPDNDPNGPRTPGDLTVGMTKEQRPNQFYDIVDPKTGISYPASPRRVWSYIPESMNKRILEGRILFPKDSGKKPMLKRYLNDLKSDINPISTLLIDVGLNSEGTKILQDMFGEKPFDYPKPLSLLVTLISQVTQPGDIILDSFAGSGTTAHAVLNLNKDGGNRKFILLELMDYADTITAERTKRVIKGYGEGSSATEGTGGGFSYYILGQTLFDEEDNLNETIDLETIKQYIRYTETKTTYVPQQENYFLGRHKTTDYYFYYEHDRATVLDLDFLASTPPSSDYRLIYADVCHLSTSFLTKYKIIFKKIPRDITRF